MATIHSISKVADARFEQASFVQSNLVRSDLAAIFEDGVDAIFRLIDGEAPDNYDPEATEVAGSLIDTLSELVGKVHATGEARIDRSHIEIFAAGMPGVARLMARNASSRRADLGAIESASWLMAEMSTLSATDRH